MPRGHALALALATCVVVTGAMALDPRDAQAQAPELTYALTARLEPAAHQLTASGRITLVHHASTPLREIVLHLYPNAFEHGRTVFAREGGTRLRGRAPTRAGRLELSTLRTHDGTDLLSGAQHELVPDDRTQLRAQLPQPLPAGERLTLHVRFTVQLPSLTARMGQAGDFCMVAQWFPKLARLRDDGTWSSTPYHGAAEFDADFADYTLEVDVPASFVVAAPGERSTVRVHGGRRTERYTLERARDLAWAASPSLAVTRRTHGPYDIDVFAPLGHTSLAVQQAELAGRALHQLGAWLGAYPYRRLVVVLPPPHAEGAAGMEYSGLIVGWTVHWHSALSPAGRALLDFVTLHELAHQWFPMLVASDEVQSPWLDEGLSEWIALRAMAERFDRAAFMRLVGVPLDVFDLATVPLATRRDLASSLRPASSLHMHELAPSMYARPALVLEHLARTYGHARMLRALRRYAHEHRFEQVVSADLFAAVDAEHGAGFSARELVPALEGEDDRALLAPRATQREARLARTAAATLPSRLLFLAQALLGWLGP